jgi:hypothetical protein
MEPLAVRSVPVRESCSLKEDMASWPDVAGVISIVSAVFSLGLKMQPLNPHASAMIENKYMGFLNDAATDIKPPRKGDGNKILFLTIRRPHTFKSTINVIKNQ